MFRKKVSSNEVDIPKLNDVISLSKRILKILYIFLIIVGIYAVIMVSKELNVMPFIKTILKIVAPLFVGIIIAWLFDPIVRWLKRKGIKRGIGSAIVYFCFIAVLALIIGTIIPMLSDQINDFAKTIPQLFNTIKDWIENIFSSIGTIGNFDSESLKTDIFNQIEQFGSNLTNNLPNMTVSLIKSIFSGLGVFVVGLIIGFYLLVSFDNVDETIITLLPKKLQSDANGLANQVNGSLRKFVEGTLIDALLVFVVSTIAFSIIGLKAPLLFGLFCGITNIIPYAGPYIGGAPAVIVGFSQGPLTGILTLAVIAVIQFIEGNFLQPLIMSKTTKLHPVTIMLGLLVFGHFWGIIGMIVSTPIIASLKSIIMYFDEKYDILSFN